MKVGTNGGYYNLLNVCETCPWALIVYALGERAQGKTQYAAQIAYWMWILGRRQTSWIRNKKVELEDGFGDGLIKNMEDRGLDVSGTDEKGRPVWHADDDGVYCGNDPVILFQSISTFSNRRGNATPDVDFVFFDEFLPEDRRFPKDAGLGFLSLLHTLLRGRDNTLVLCASNYVSAGNPYFVRFRIYPSKDILTPYEDKGIVIERTARYRKKIAEGNPWTKVFAAGKYKNYSDAMEDDLADLVEKIPKGAAPEPIIIRIDGENYRAFDKNGLIYWKLWQGDVKAVCYTPNVTECSRTVTLMPNWLMKQYAEDFKAGRFRFTDPNVMFAIMHLLYSEA